MPGLKEFSLLDWDRALVRLTGSQSPGDKVGLSILLLKLLLLLLIRFLLPSPLLLVLLAQVLVYSAFKRAIIEREVEDDEVVVMDAGGDTRPTKRSRLNSFELWYYY